MSTQECTECARWGHHRTAQFPLHGLYRREELVAVALGLADRLLRHYAPGGDPKMLWEAWRVRGWLRHDPDRFTLRLSAGNRRRRWLALTWATWEQTMRDHHGGMTAERSEHETHSPERRCRSAS